MSAPRFVSQLLLAPIVALAFFLRVWFQRQILLVDGSTHFSEHDAWHHMRLVDAVVRDFPHRLLYDVYGHFGGELLRTGPLFDLLVAGVALTLGGGAPSSELVDKVGAWLPALLGTALVLPVYALGRLLFDRNVGLAAAAVFAVLPGGVLRRTAFGFADHHALELFFGVLALLALGLALRVERERPLSLRDVLAHPRRHGRWLVAATAAGLALGAYLITWTSGVFLLAILFLWLVLDLLLRAARGEALAPPALALALAFATALPLPLLYKGELAGTELVAGGLGGGLAAALGLAALGAKMDALRRRLRLAALGAALLVPPLGAALLFPAFAAEAIHQALRLVPSSPGASSIVEMQPLFASPASAWREYATALPLAAFGGALAIARMCRTPRSELLLMLVYAFATLTATLLQKRFSFYFAIVVAVLAGLAFVRAASWLGSHAASRVSTRLHRWSTVPLLGATLLLPTGAEALIAAHTVQPVPAWWRGALAWLHERSPEPFGDPAAYYTRFARPSGGAPFAYPDSAYSVLAWWDHGYWIQRIARRIPVANPAHQGVDAVAAFLLARRPNEAMAILDRVRARYVIVDSERAVGAGTLGLEVVARWAGRPRSELVEVCNVREPDGSWTVLPLFLPAYYESMAVRLWTFGGQAYEPRNATWLVTSRTNSDEHGRPFCEITKLERFTTFQDAERARATDAYQGARIVGRSLVASPVPLERLERFRHVYASQERTLVPGTRSPGPVLRIFEYDGAATGTSH